MLRDDDRGFSLAELLVVVGLLGIVLAGAWAGFAAIMQSNQVNESVSTAATDLSNPVEQMSRILMQGEIVSANEYQVYVETNRSGSRELDLFRATGDGRLVWWRITPYVSENPLPGDADARWVKWEMSASNANVINSAPLFTYRDANRDPVDLADVATLSRQIDIDVLVEKNGRTAENTRTVLLRGGD